MKNLKADEIENMRRIMGTLPSDKPIKSTCIKSLIESSEVTLEDSSENPYKAMFVTATSTWGDNNFIQKWPETSVEGKLEVIKAVLTHNTLPQAKEMVQFVFRVKGVPRWLFDYHVQSTQFIAFMSIGCRDNCKLDADIVKNENSLRDVILFSKLKDLYEFALSDGEGSWQTARAFLPQSYSHSYHFGQNLMSLVSTRGFHASRKFDTNDIKDAYLMSIYKKIQIQIVEKFPLLGLYTQILFNDNEFIFEKIRNLRVSDLYSSDLYLFLKK